MAITPLPSAPSVTDDTATFNTKAFAWVDALDEFTTEANALAIQVNADAQTAEEGAAAADAALGAANFKGEWSSLTGALNIPASVSHNGKIWVLTQNLADVTSNEPGVDSPNFWINVTPQVPSVFEFIATGSLSDGSTVTINSDGTVSVVSGALKSAGSEASITANTISLPCATYDVNAQSVVIIYSDSGNSNYGTAIVGSVSGTSITFGSPVVYKSASVSFHSIVYNSNAKKVVIAFWDGGNSNYGTGVVGTVAGTSISFGTPAVFESADSRYISSTFDSTNNKVVITYSDFGNSEYGTAVVGTVSGTSISFGTPAVFESARSASIWCTYDSNAQKVFISYSDGGNSQYGTGVVGTVSGTSISFGTPVVFRSATIAYGSCTYDPIAQKVVVAYFDFGSSNKGFAVVGTISSTAVSFGTPVNFNNTALGGFQVLAVYDSYSKKIAITYNSTNKFIIFGLVSGTTITFETELQYSTGVSNYLGLTPVDGVNKLVTAYNSSGGKSLVITSPFSTLTATNFIGISNGAYSNGQTAQIQTVGAVDDAQTSLTPGLAYYVQPDGSLSSAAGVPSVFAGTAVSATKLIVKG